MILSRLSTSLTAATFILTLSAAAAAQPSGVDLSSTLGSSGDDEVTAVETLRDGTILIGGSFASSPPGAIPEVLGDATSDDGGLVAVLTPDGLTLERWLRVGASVHDMAVDDDDNIFIAAGSSGLVQLDPDLEWRRTKTLGDVWRVDAGGGIVAALAPDSPEAAHDTPGPGTITLLQIDSGAERASFVGYQQTMDLCVDPATRTVALIGWRTDTLDDRPIDVAYLKGYSAQGFINWSNYDWPTQETAPDFIEAAGPNRAGTRGYRCSVGPDGFLLASFEADGDQHLFRYAPQDPSSPVPIVGGDEFHDFSRSRNEAKLFFARYDPADGAYLLGQQLTARMPDGNANRVRARRGSIEADVAGNVYITGEASYGLPLTELLPNTGDYTGGAFLLAMDADFQQRLLVTRVTPDGAAHDVSPAQGGRLVYVGTHELADRQFFTKNIFQPTAGGTTDGFVAVFGEGVADTRSGSGGAQDGCSTTPAEPTPGWLLLGAAFLAFRLTRRQ